MKKIINGKLYNTETATYLGTRRNGKLMGDFSRLEEDIYRKDNGEFFLHGNGGGLTLYNGGEDCLPLTDNEAREWIERHLTADKYIEIFGEVQE